MVDLFVCWVAEDEKDHKSKHCENVRGDIYVRFSQRKKKSPGWRDGRAMKTFNVPILPIVVSLLTL